MTMAKKTCLPQTTRGGPAARRPGSPTTSHQVAPCDAPLAASATSGSPRSHLHQILTRRPHRATHTPRALLSVRAKAREPGTPPPPGSSPRLPLKQHRLVDSSPRLRSRSSCLCLAAKPQKRSKKIKRARESSLSSAVRIEQLESDLLLLLIRALSSPREEQFRLAAPPSFPISARVSEDVVGRVV